MIDDINIANYTDDNTLFVSGDALLLVKPYLENVADWKMWFSNNHMKSSHDKCNLLMSMLTPISFNPFVSNAFFPYPMKTLKNRRVFWRLEG